ncbi:hypothetical protein BRYFOR_07466 [Marvinbryantia formatexigens DSM 14469]|uniref:Uncharacterized protein n=1 Tax=Marvinbryantia formatexigens DSM 14469 TaxID=478749 RepID=C6LFQ5_9FIRM|nr:hypothetical protein BRYFOR_07466 [Marvinbryantia formatexigens DSM 14469]
MLSSQNLPFKTSNSSDITWLDCITFLRFMQISAKIWLNCF